MSNKRLKFRTWNGNEFLYWGFGSYNGNMNIFTSPHRPDLDSDQFVTMWAGKQMWENDIVSCYDAIREDWIIKDALTISIVHYDKVREGFVLRQIKENIDGDPCDSTINMVSRLKIIGNVYENPDLLVVK